MQPAVKVARANDTFVNKPEGISDPFWSTFDRAVAQALANDGLPPASVGYEVIVSTNAAVQLLNALSVIWVISTRIEEIDDVRDNTTSNVTSSIIVDWYRPEQSVDRRLLAAFNSQPNKKGDLK